MSATNSSSSFYSNQRRSTTCGATNVVNLAKVKRLKPKFADAIIDLEEAVEAGDFDQNTVNKLLEAYEEAVQYYNAKNADRKA